MREHAVRTPMVGPLMHTRLLSDENANLTATSSSSSAMASMEHSASTPLLVDVLWRRRWTVALTVLACMVAAALYLMVATPVYMATARVVVEQGPIKLYSDAQGAMPQSETFLQTEADTFQSGVVLRRALDAVGYRQLKTFAKVSGDPVAWLRRGNSFKVDVARKSDVITVSMESAYPAEAASFVKAVVNAYVAEKSAQRQSTGVEMVRALSEQ